MEPNNLVATTVLLRPLGGFYPSPGIWFYATFLTTAWSCLYVIASLTLRLTAAMWPFRNVLNVGEKPFESIGVYAALLVALALAGFTIVRWAVVTLGNVL